MPAISLPELVQQIGLEELAGIDSREVSTDFIPAAVTGLADGDIAVLHPPYTGRQAEFYGENTYNDGRVAKAMAQAAINNGMQPGHIYDFQGFAAEYFTQPESPFATHKTESSVRIYPENLTVDDNRLELTQVPTLIFDYGACLTGRSYIADQVGFLNSNLRPFTYSPLTRTHFMNQTLINTYNANYGPGTSQAVIENQLYIGREDGIALATDEVLRAQQAHNASTDVADVILCTGVQHASEADLLQGITNAHSLLKEGGKLVVRSLARPASDEVGTDKIVNWALESGFDERGTVRYEADLGQVGALLLGGHFGKRKIRTVVLTK